MKEKNEHRKLPEPIASATPEQVAKAIMKVPPKKEWRFMQKSQPPRSQADILEKFSTVFCKSGKWCRLYIIPQNLVYD